MPPVASSTGNPESAAAHAADTASDQPPPAAGAMVGFPVPGHQPPPQQPPTQPPGANFPPSGLASTSTSPGGSPPTAIPAAWASQGIPADMPPASAPGPTPAPAASTPPPAEPVGELLEPARIVARVGDQVILAGDVAGTVAILMAVQLKDVPPEEQEKASLQIENMRRQLFKQALKAEVNTKLGYIDFMRTVPPEKHSELQKRVKQSFERELDEVRTKLAEAKTDEQKAELVSRNMLLARLAILMQHYQLDNLGQLDARLRTLGSSLDKQQRAYGDQKLQQMAVLRNIRQNVEITHEQMLQHYREHQEEYAIPAKARWEQLTVRFDRFPSEDAAVAALAEMGNAVYLGGASLAAVAKKSSQEPNAEDGGLHEWTQKGSLASKPLDEALFTLPTGRLSQMIRDDRGLHIVRVLERTEAGHRPFVDVQSEIKDQIRLERRNKDIQAYFDKVRANTTVWTIDDEP